MWQPKSKEFEDVANNSAREYESGGSVTEIARVYRLSNPSIYRYLRYKNVPIRTKRRNDKGKFIPSR